MLVRMLKKDISPHQRIKILNLPILFNKERKLRIIPYYGKQINHSHKYLEIHSSSRTDKLRDTP